MSDWKIPWEKRHASELGRVMEAASLARKWAEATGELFSVRYWPGEWSFYPDEPGTKYKPEDVDGWFAVLIDGRAACPRGWSLEALTRSPAHAAEWTAMVSGGATRRLPETGVPGTEEWKEDLWSCWWRP